MPGHLDSPAEPQPNTDLREVELEFLRLLPHPKVDPETHDAIMELIHELHKGEFSNPVMPNFRDRIGDPADLEEAASFARGVAEKRPSVARAEEILDH